jgi:DHA1 family bicyclomycin/chloramphenicol resistance-like MFS transporter
VNPGPLFAVALGAITIIGPLAIHLFLPAIPAVKAAFGVSDAVAQLSLSATLFGMGVLTLVYGSLSDRYGRRSVLMWSLYAFLAGTVVTVVSDDIVLFVLGRFLQAAGAAGGGALSRAIARDVYGEDKLVQAIAYLTMAYTLGPMIAPPLGGFLVDQLGWRSLFVFALVVGGAITLLAHLVIFESHRPHPTPGAVRAMWVGYATLFRNARFCGFVFQTGFSTAAFFTIAAASTSLMMETLQRPAIEYGLFFLAFPIGFSSGNFVASRLSGKIAIETMVMLGAVLSLVTIVTQDALVLTGHLDPWTLFVPGGIVTFAQGLSMPFAQTGAMRIAPRYAGTAAGIGGFMSQFFGAISVELAGLFADGTAVPMSVLATSSALLSLVAAATSFLMARRGATSRAPSRRSG